MPTETDAPIVQQIDLETEAFKDAFSTLSDAYALTLVNKTFYQYDTWRQQNHDVRWNTNDGLYLGWLPQRTWTGTTVPRSSLPMPIVFDQVESALPAILQALFNQPDWFQAEAEPGATPEQARQQAQKLLYDLEHNKDGFGLSARNDIELAIKSVLTYGNGGISVEWDPTKRKPVITWADIRDLYLDPGASIPAVDYCRSVIRRSMKTVEEVREWKDLPGMKIPDDDVLWGMARNQLTAQADRTKQTQAALMGINYVPGASDWLPNPTDRKVEILTYYSKTRIIMVFNREWVAFSGANPYGFIPFCFAPCYTVVGRWYAMGIPDVQEGNQRYIEALLNGRLDEISLAIQPPRNIKASALMTPAQQRWAPGSTSKSAEPQKDIQYFSPTNATANVYSEIDFIQQAAEKRTGINSLSTGVPQASNANRTLGGMSMQMQGASLRLTSIVKHIEDYLIVPLLYKMSKMTEVHARDMGEEETFPGFDDNRQIVDIPKAAFERPVRFRMLASSQMVTREKLAQIFPFILQYLTQGPLVQNLVQGGFTVDWGELFAMLQDASGVGKLYQLIRPMSEQERQAFAQQQQQAQQAEQQRATLDAQTRLQMGQMKADSTREGYQVELQKEAMKKQVDPAQMQMELQKMQMEMQKMQMELEFEREKLKLKQEEMVQKLRLSEAQNQMKAQQSQMDLLMGVQKARTTAAIDTQKAQLDSERMQSEHTLGMEMAEEKAEFQRQQMREPREEKPTGKKSKKET